MTKIRKILFILCSAAVLLLASCGNDITTGTVKGDGIKANKKVTLNLSTNGDYTVFTTKSNSSERTIVSESYDSEGLTFYLYGQNVTKGTYLDLQEISVIAKAGTDNKEGTASLEIGSFVWDLSIVAYANDAVPNPLPTFDGPSAEADVLAEAVLVGKAYADLRGTTNQVDFVLMPDGLTKTGLIALSVYTGGWTMDTDFSAKIGIYDHETGTEISALTPTAKADLDTEKTFDSTTALLPNAKPGSANYTANGAEVAPGNDYDLIVEFTAPTGKKYYWSDNLIVLPGKGTTADVVIPNTIMQKPSEPTAFKAGYFEPTADDTSLYNVRFDWVRSSTKTEKNYELEIANLGVPDDPDDTYTTPTDNDEWDAAVALSSLTTTVTYGQDFAYNPYIWADGSLKKASHTAVAKLVLGNRYIVRIRAVNEAGESDWVYPTLNNTTNSATAFSSQTINLYRITYQESDPNGVAATYDPGSTATVEYHNQDETTGIEIMFPNRNANDTRAVTVTDSSDAYWSYWKDYNDKDSAPENYKGFENLTLIPIFAKQANIIIHDDSAYLMDRTNITIDMLDSAGTTVAPAARTFDANDSITVNISTDTEDAEAEGIATMVWTIDYDGIEYSYCYLTMAKTSNLESYIYNKSIVTPANTFTVDVSICESAKYLAVLHYGINNKEYTLPLLVSIVE